MARHAFEFKGLNQPFRRCDLAVHASEPVIIAVRPAQDEAPGAARADDHFATDHRHAPWPPPMRHMFGPGDGLKDEPARGVEDAGDKDLPIRRHCECCRVFACHIDFSFSRLSASLSKDSFQPAAAISLITPDGMPTWRKVSLVLP